MARLVNLKTALPDTTVQTEYSAGEATLHVDILLKIHDGKGRDFTAVPLEKLTNTNDKQHKFPLASAYFFAPRRLLRCGKLEEPADPTSHSSHRLNRIQSGRDVSPRFPSAQPY